jgi:hypothetical protein
MNDVKPTSVRVLAGLLWFEAVLTGLVAALFVILAGWEFRQEPRDPEGWDDLGLAIGVAGAVAAGVVLLAVLGLVSLARRRRRGTPGAVVLLHGALLLLAAQVARSQGLFVGVVVLLVVPVMGLALTADSRRWFSPPR